MSFATLGNRSRYSRGQEACDAGNSGVNCTQISTTGIDCGWFDWRRWTSSIWRYERWTPTSHGIDNKLTAQNRITHCAENAALPHGSGTDRKLQWGDFILVDVGGKLHGYISDITRVSVQLLTIDS